MEREKNIPRILSNLEKFQACSPIWKHQNFKSVLYNIQKKE